MPSVTVGAWIDPKFYLLHHHLIRSLLLGKLLGIIWVFQVSFTVFTGTYFTVNSVCIDRHGTLQRLSDMLSKLFHCIDLQVFQDLIF